ncbi:SDR family oxidoreductase [Massilia sp. W12]|uniref:SDR family oxidoreductase n=1 Tax=Massilia sp. W12 TaxID=3126507 RepID=UPI0030D435F4
MPKKILLTGASSGLGAALAVELAARGHQVWATMRQPEKKLALLDAAAARGMTLDSMAVHIDQLDVENADSVQASVARMLHDWGGVDVLINNAGAGFLRPFEQTTADDWRWVMEVNFFGALRCTQAVLPAMRAARQGHILNISSVGGLVGQPFNELYCAAKFALEGFTEALAVYMEAGFNLHFTLVEPGGIQSDFAKNVLARMPGTPPAEDDPYAPLLAGYIHRARSRKPEDVAHIYQSSAQVAQVIADCMEQEQPPLRLRTSPWAEEFCRFKTGADPDGTLQKKMVAGYSLGV